MNFGVQMGAQFGNDRVEDRNTGNLKFPAAVFKQVADVLVDNSVKNEAGVFANSLKHLFDLMLGSDHGPKAFMSFNGVELHQARACDQTNGFSRRIRYQVKMKGFYVLFAHLALWAVWG